MCGRADIEEWGKLREHATPSDLRQWISAHGDSPLLVIADAELVSLEAEESTQLQARMEADARRTHNEAIAVSLRKIEENKRAQEQTAAKAKKDKAERWHRSMAALVIGSLLAIPIFFVVYALLAAAAFVGFILLQWLHVDRMSGGGVSRMAELFGAGAAGYWGVEAGKNAAGTLLKSWSGWPAFLLLVTGWLAAFYAFITLTNFAEGWWWLVLMAVHSLIAIGVGFALLARKHMPT